MVNFFSAKGTSAPTDGTVITGVKKDDDGKTLTVQDAEGELHRIAKEDIDEKKTNKPIYNDIFLSNYALINVKDELLRVDGVSDINIMGERDYSIRAWLDPQKLAARNMTAIDVARTSRAAQNLASAPLARSGSRRTTKDQAFQLPLDALGRLSLPEQFSNIIVKVGSGMP